MKKYLSLIILIFFSATAISNVINVTSYGAITNDDIDDTEAIKTAMAACNKNGATLNFSSGTYLIQGNGSGNPIFSFDGYHNLTINGNNAVLSCKNWDVVFYSQNSSQISISNFTILWERDLPFSYGTITAKGSGYIDIRLADAQVVRTGLKTEAILQYDPINMRPITNGWDCYQYEGFGLTEKVSSNIMRCFTSCYYNVGENVIIRHQVYGSDVFGFIKVNGVSLSNILIYSGAGMGVVGFGNTNVTIDNLQIKRYGSRWMSTCADGIHLGSTRGAINIKNCYLQGMGDDGFNIHGMYYKVQYVSGNSLCLRDASSNSTPNWWDIPVYGDVLSIMDPSTMIKKGEATVVSSSSDAGNVCLLVNFNSIGTSISTGDFLYNKNAVASLNITKSTVEKNRARGMLIQTSNVNVSECTFNECSGTAALITSTTGGYFIESSPPEHVTIRDCNFNRCNYGTISMNAPLMLYTNTSTNQYASPVINDIHINNNTFTTISDQPGVYIRSSKNVYLDSNKFSNKTVQQIEYKFDDNEICNIYVNRKASTSAIAFGGSPITLPAKIEAEDFDKGGEGIGYHDLTIANLGGSNYRNGERVDVYDNGNGGHGINYIDCSEWLGYTIQVPQNGIYNLIINGSTDFDWSSYHVESNFKFLTPVKVFPNTHGWSNFKNDTIQNVYLEKGTYQIKFVWDNLAVSLDYLKFDFVCLPVLSISEDILTIEATANNTKTFNITSNTSWSLTSNQNWLTFSKSTGSGNAAISLIAKANTTSVTRTAVVTITGMGVSTRTITVNQKGKTTCVFDIPDEEYSIYPNPTSNILFFDKKLNTCTVSIFNILGEMILSDNIIDNRIDISRLQHGIYTIRIVNTNKIIMRKIIKL